MLEQFIWNLEILGIADILLPFILIFTLVFAVLQKSKILGKDKKNFNVIVALVMGLAVVIPHVTGAYPPGQDIVEILNSALPNVSMVIVVILMVLLVIGVFGFNVNIGKEGTFGGWIALISAIIVVYIFGAAADWYAYPYWLYWLRDGATQSFIIVILVFAMIIWFITKEPEKDKKDTFSDKLSKLLEKPSDKE